MLRRSMLLALLPLWPLCMAAQPAAPPPPPWAELRGDLDGDGRPERAWLGRDGLLRIDGDDGRELTRVALPEPGRIVRAQLRLVTVEDRPALHARAELGRGQAAEAVVAGGRVLYVGRTGPVGDGERLERLRVDEAGVVRYQTAPGVSRCDGEDELFAERWDFAGARFRPVTVEPPRGLPLAATATAPAGLSGPPLGLFRFVAASSDDAGERRADLLAAPRELDDGAPATVWHAGFGATARGIWATARAQAGAVRVRAVELTGGKAAPRALTLLLGKAARFTVAMAPGTRWVELPPTAPTACLSIVVAEPGAGDNALAEVAIYSDIDGPGGVQRLVEQVVTGGGQADGAARLLQARGSAATAALTTALPLAHGDGRLRLLQLLAALADPQAAAPLATALQTATPAERPLLVAALGRLGAAGVAAAAPLLADESQTHEARADAATILGQAGGPAATAALVAAAGRGDAAVRAATMQALARQLPGQAAAVVTALAAAAGHDDEATGDLARALADGVGAAPAELRARAAAAVADAWRATAAAHFAPRLRLVRALGRLGDAAALPALTEAARDGEPVVRAAALQAAAGLAGGAALAQAALGDPDPGVRKAALAAAASGHAEVRAAAAAALAGDGWPMVRQAAADALDCAAAPALARAVSGDDARLRGADPSPAVRRAALTALGRCSPPLPTLATVLAERRQPAEVRELAAALVARRGGAPAARALAAALDDTLGGLAADESGAGLAVACTRALGRTGDRSRPILEALGEAAAEPLSPSIRAAAMETIGELCPSGAAAALIKGARDPDGNVVRAARLARERCHQ